jgi:hypothetical protein
VIESSPEKCILVDAGPGTGKTAVACARVAWLINNGVFGDKIWLISFTRTAVQEIRNRIRTSLNNEESAYAVKVATLDSHAWQIFSGFDGGANLNGTYNENIGKLTQLIREDITGDISEYLESVEHLIVDEAQDIVGIRAELLMEIIGKLSDNCGITVFSDDAQAIYGFSQNEDDNEDNKKQKTLSEQIREKLGNRFSMCELNKVYRTNSHTLNELFTDTRKKVLKPSDKPLNKLCEIRGEISRLADKSEKVLDNYPENCFLLYRRRAEVLMAASNFRKNPHRIRMAELPICIHPWVGACFSEHSDKTLSKKDFMKYWIDGVEGTTLAKGIDSGIAWAQLVRLAGKTHSIIDMTKLRRLLGHEKPPADFCSSEIGTGGPIIGTIHSSKGRETDIVYLNMPKESDNKKTDFDEETRVVFVGATRARKYLKVGNRYNDIFQIRLKSSGRVYSKDKGDPRVEIGRIGDVLATGIAGTAYYANEDSVRLHQKSLLSMADKINSAIATYKHSFGRYFYRVKLEDDDEYFAVLNERLSDELFRIGKDIYGYKKRPPDKLTDLRIYGIRTIVLPPDSLECDNIYEPWASSGIMLAPVILGYTKNYFPNYRAK